MFWGHDSREILASCIETNKTKSMRVISKIRYTLCKKPICHNHIFAENDAESRAFSLNPSQSLTRENSARAQQVSTLHTYLNVPSFIISTYQFLAWNSKKRWRIFSLTNCVPPIPKVRHCLYSLQSSPTRREQY